MVLFKKILIPTDGSEYTKAAVRKDWRWPRRPGRGHGFVRGGPDLLHQLPHGLPIVSVYTLLEREGEEAMEYVKKEAEALGVKVTTRIEEGSPSRKIVDLSAEHDLVVMGTLGRTVSPNCCWAASRNAWCASPNAPFSW